MAYTPPVSTAIPFVFSGTTYTPPASTAIPFVFADPVVTTNADAEMVALILGPLITGARVDPPTPVEQEGPRLFAQAGFVMRPDDATYPNRHFDGRIKGEIDASLEVSCVFWGARSGFSLGQIALNNHDGALDGLRDVGVKGRTVEIRSGAIGDLWADWNVDYVGVAESIEFADQSIARLIVANKAAALDVPLQSAVYPSSANASIIGQPLPLTFGTPLNVPPVLTVPGTLTYETGGTSIAVVRDQGVALTVTTEYTAAAGVVTLLQAPVGRITIDPVHTSGDDIQSFIEKVLAQAGYAAGTLGDLGGLDVAPNIRALGFYADSPITCAQLLDRLLDSYCGWWFFGRDGLLHCGQLKAPSGTADLTITREQFAFGEQISVLTDTMPGYSNTVAGRRNYHIHTPGELASSLTSPTVTQTGADLQQDYRTRAIATGSGPSNPAYAEDVGDSNGARVNTQKTGIGTLLTDATQCQTEADRWLTLRSVRRAFFDLPLLLPTSVIRTIEPGMTVKVSGPLGADGTARFGLTDKYLLVRGFRTQVQSNKILLKCWG